MQKLGKKLFPSFPYEHPQICVRQIIAQLCGYTYMLLHPTSDAEKCEKL
jgi:hypothetical protein